LNSEFDTDLHQEANDFKTKGDNFYMGQKYEQAYKAYSIAIDLLQHYCTNEQLKHNKNIARQPNIVEMKLSILLSMAEAAF
jgi:hypothetical protein